MGDIADWINSFAIGASTICPHCGELTIHFSAIVIDDYTNEPYEPPAICEECEKILAEDEKQEYIDYLKLYIKNKEHLDKRYKKEIEKHIQYIEKTNKLK